MAKDQKDDREEPGEKTESPLLEAMCSALAETFAFYFKAHVFHWNVMGPGFPQLHELFGDIYEDAHEAVDAIAERIRTLGEHTPMGLRDLLEKAKITDADGMMGAAPMVDALRSDNEKVIEALSVAYLAGDKAHELGLCNFLQDRIDKHAKWNWILSATASKEAL